jgi:hypothetical protein
MKLFRFPLKTHTNDIRYIKGIKALNDDKLLCALSIILVHPKKILSKVHPKKILSKTHYNIFPVILSDDEVGEVTCLFNSKNKIWKLDVLEFGSFFSNLGYNKGNIIFSKL